jgi:hypothetical protein
MTAAVTEPTFQRPHTGWDQRLLMADLCLTRVYKVGTTGFTLSSIPIDASTHRSSLLIGAD